jgi:predicted RNA binding protein YcfA (HicA-like mRNA interferase family)
MSGYRRDVLRELEVAGYVKLPDRRGKGSHEIWTNGRRNQTVPRKIDDRNLANDIMKQAGIARRFA